MSLDFLGRGEVSIASSPACPSDVAPQEVAHGTPVARLDWRRDPPAHPAPLPPPARRDGRPDRPGRHPAGAPNVGGTSPRGDLDALGRRAPGRPAAPNV